MIDRTISHYKVTGVLGEGGMGIVYKAEDTKLERTVALKFLASHLLEDEEGHARFIREAKAAASLDHPNICTVYEIDEVEGETFIAMAYLEGQTVKAKIAERPLKLDEALDIAIQTAQGLQAAHEKDIVHRDIKSANLMVTPQGQVKIMDFGLAQLAEGSKLTKTATILGTPAYMSPEQSQRLPTDRRTDIWSLGVVVYEMVTGRTPFEGERQEAVLYAIGSEDPEPITALRAGLPMELEWIVGKALAKDKEERYQHVEEMLVDLRGLTKKLASGKSTILSAQPAVAPVAPSNDLVPTHKQRFLQALFAVTAIAFLTLAFIYFRETPSKAPLRRFAFTPPEAVGGTTYNTNVAISPNGKHIAFITAGSKGKLWVQDLDQRQPRAIDGTEGADYPFWSPDSDFIGFRPDGGGELKKVSVQGGLAIRVCELPGTNSRGGNLEPGRRGDRLQLRPPIRSLRSSQPRGDSQPADLAGGVRGVAGRADRSNRLAPFPAVRSRGPCPGVCIRVYYRADHDGSEPRDRAERASGTRLRAVLFAQRPSCVPIGPANVRSLGAAFFSGHLEGYR